MADDFDPYYTWLGIPPEDKPFEFQVTVWESDFPVESFPLEGWLTVPVPV